MSIIPASRLSLSDMSLLGNNVTRSRRRRRLRAARDQTASRQFLDAVQRSLATVGECVGELLPAAASAGGGHGR